MNQALQSADINPLDALKNQTFTLHKALEKRLAFPETFASKTRYADVLILFYVFQRQFALDSEKFQSQVASQFALTKRQRLPLIEHDMQQLSVELVDISQFAALHLTSLDEFYGCLYVNEGSTLGGNIIQAEMLKIHGESALNWTHYLNPYGQDMMPMWQSFRAALLAELAAGHVSIDGVISGAAKSFQFMLDTAALLGFTDKS